MNNTSMINHSIFPTQFEPVISNQVDTKNLINNCEKLAHIYVSTALSEYYSTLRSMGGNTTIAKQLLDISTSPEELLDINLADVDILKNIKIDDLEQYKGQENSDLLLILGYKYIEKDTPNDIEKGMTYLKKASETNNSNASFLYGFYLLKNDKIEDGIRSLFKADLQGNNKAKILLGQFYEEGRHLKQNAVIAFKKYEAAAQSGNELGLCLLGKCYEQGIGVPKSFDEASKTYHKAEAKNFKPASHALKELKLYTALDSFQTAAADISALFTKFSVTPENLSTRGAAKLTTFFSQLTDLTKAKDCSQITKICTEMTEFAQEISSIQNNKKSPKKKKKLVKKPEEPLQNPSASKWNAWSEISLEGLALEGIALEVNTNEGIVTVTSKNLDIYNAVLQILSRYPYINFKNDDNLSEIKIFNGDKLTCSQIRSLPKKINKIIQSLNHPIIPTSVSSENFNVVPEPVLIASTPKKGPRNENQGISKKKLITAHVLDVLDEKRLERERKELKNQNPINDTDFIKVETVQKSETVINTQTKPQLTKVESLAVQRAIFQLDTLIKIDQEMNDPIIEQNATVYCLLRLLEALAPTKDEGASEVALGSQLQSMLGVIRSRLRSPLYQLETADLVRLVDVIEKHVGPQIRKLLNEKLSINCPELRKIYKEFKGIAPLSADKMQLAQQINKEVAVLLCLPKEQAVWHIGDFCAAKKVLCRLGKLFKNMKGIQLTKAEAACIKNIKKYGNSIAHHFSDTHNDISDDEVFYIVNIILNNASINKFEILCLKFL